MTIPSDPRAKDAAPAHGSAAALGLSSAEARCRLAEYGANATPDASAHPLRLILSNFVAPVPCLLEAAIALQLFLGEHIEAGLSKFVVRPVAEVSSWEDETAWLAEALLDLQSPDPPG